MIAFDAGRCAAEHDRTALQLRPQDRHVTRLITGRFLLFIRRLVFLVDHDQPELGQRCEDGAAGADNDARMPVVDLVPFVVAFAGGEMTMEHRDPILYRRETALEALDRLRRQRNFRHQHQSRLAAVQGEGDRLEIDLGFAAAGHPMQEDRLLFGGGGIERGAHLGQGDLLLARECLAGAGQEGLVVVGIATDGLRCQRDPAGAGERLEGLVRGAAFAGERPGPPGGV